MPVLAQVYPSDVAAEDKLGNPEMKAMLEADQAARKGNKIDDWQAVAKADAARRVRVRELLDAGKLTTQHDFYAAAFIWQHGDEPEDYLLAHALAVRSLGLGMKEAEWIAAATLDRYLQAIARDQIYGTQYSWRPDKGATRGKFDPALLPDQIRVGAGVEPLAAQEAKRLEIEKRNAARK